MGKADHTIALYSAQAEPVIRVIDRDGACFSKREYVERKYQESAPIFVAAYSWFVGEAEKRVPKPQGAEYPYWAFQELYSVDSSGDRVLELRVPVEEAVFFDMFDWNKVIRLQYIGESKAEEDRFRHQLVDYGIRRESDVILTSFYPELKRQVQESWQRLFRHHEKIKSGEPHGAQSVQAGLWRIKKEWLV